MLKAFSKRIKKWYNGETKSTGFEEGNGYVVFPIWFTEYHWTAKALRSSVSFYLKHWQWVWGTVLAVIGLFASISSIA